MAGETEWPLPPPAPVRFTLTSMVVLFVRLRKKTSKNLPPPSFVDRLLAELRKRTNRPSALITDPEESLFPPTAAGIEGLASDTACTAESARPFVADARTQPRIAHQKTLVCDCCIVASFCPLASLRSEFIHLDKLVLFESPFWRKNHATNLRRHTSLTIAENLSSYGRLAEGGARLVRF